MRNTVCLINASLEKLIAIFQLMESDLVSAIAFCSSDISVAACDAILDFSDIGDQVTLQIADWKKKMTVSE